MKIIKLQLRQWIYNKYQYNRKIKYGTEKTLPFCQGEAIKTVIKKYKIPVKGIIINDFDDGYPVSELKRDLQNLTGIKVLGSIPFLKDMSDTSLYRIFKKNIDLKSLLR